ncbi:13209_t:CDS:2 [Ambispora gerdemannii]|uniref:13209_t:CDS:1 n=1 Tax=Ambispora gerdemannii TaxID=144530 RepID=A0A9N9EC26_9GLOM|nr:13209_t:CDS:2 [Ambispora gerdemannii]
MNIGLRPQEANFSAFLRYQKKQAPEQVLSAGNESDLRKEFMNSQLSTERYQLSAGWERSNQLFGLGSKHDGVALKILSISQNMTTDFLQEITNHKLLSNSDYSDIIVPCYGISQHPETKNYVMVMECIGGDITLGLKKIHEKGNSCYITDLGLCRPVSATDDDEIYGVLPYVAPEVLRGGQYTQAADVYSFGIVAAEILSGLPPYYDQSHDDSLAVQICLGLRSNLNDYLEVKGEFNQSLVNKVNNATLLQTHPQAIYTSRLLDFKNLPQPQNSKEINEQFYNLNDSTEFDIDIGELNISEKQYEQKKKEKIITSTEIRTKRQLSVSSQTELSSEKGTKLSRVIEQSKYQSEPMEIEED